MYRFNISKHRYFAQPSDTPFPKKKRCTPKGKQKSFSAKTTAKKKKDKNGSKRHFSPFLKKGESLDGTNLLVKGKSGKDHGTGEAMHKALGTKDFTLWVQRKGSSSIPGFVCRKSAKICGKSPMGLKGKTKTGYMFLAFQRAVKFLGTFERETKGGKGC